MRKGINLGMIMNLNVFCNIAKKLYDRLMKFSKSHLNSEKLHKQMLSFLEFGLSEINFEQIVSSEVVPNMSYLYGIVNAEEHLDSIQLLEIVNNTLT